MVPNDTLNRTSVTRRCEVLPDRKLVCIILQVNEVEFTFCSGELHSAVCRLAEAFQLSPEYIILGLYFSRICIHSFNRLL